MYSLNGHWSRLYLTQTPGLVCTLIYILGFQRDTPQKCMHEKKVTHSDMSIVNTKLGSITFPGRTEHMTHEPLLRKKWP